MSTEKFQNMIKALEESGDYRVLTKLKKSELKKISEADASKFTIAAVVDIETTGLNSAIDEIIEIGILKFVFDDDHTILGILDELQSLIEPTIPIPPETTRITGITDKMLAGHSIDPRKINNFMNDVSLVIAHNASFDRRFCERKWPIFAALPWGCSLSDINWKAEGFYSAHLNIILNEYRFFYDNHRALEDCYALLKVLSLQLPNSGEKVLSAILKCAQLTSVKIWAENAPFDSKEELKRRGYRWSDGSNNAPKAWWILVPEEKAKTEIEFLRKAIYKKETSIPTKKITALERYSERENTK